MYSIQLCKMIQNKSLQRFEFDKDNVARCGKLCIQLQET